MKILSVAVAAALALTPALAAAASDTNPGNKPAAGPLAGRAMSGSEIPAAAIIAGGLVIVGGLVIGILGSSDSNNNTNGPLN